MSEHANQQLQHREHQRLPMKFPLVVLLDDFTVPMNVGSIFRLCDALGVEKLFLTGTTPVPPNRKIAKTSRSTHEYVSYEYHANPLDVVTSLKHSGYTILGLESTTTSVDLRALNYAALNPICLVVGSEVCGVKRALLDCCDYTVHIPMLGNNSSLNVATACAIALFEITRNVIKSSDA